MDDVHHLERGSVVDVARLKARLDGADGKLSMASGVASAHRYITIEQHQRETPEPQRTGKLTHAARREFFAFCEFFRGYSMTVGVE